MLDFVQRDADDVGFRKPSVPIRSVRTCPVTKTVGDRIHHRVGDRGDQVGRAGAGGAKGDPRLAGGVCVTLGGVAGGLLVTGLYVPQIGVDQRVIGGQVCATGNAEDVVNTFRFGDLNNASAASSDQRSNESLPGAQGLLSG